MATVDTFWALLTREVTEDDCAASEAAKTEEVLGDPNGKVWATDGVDGFPG